MATRSVRRAGGFVQVGLRPGIHGSSAADGGRPGQALLNCHPWEKFAARPKCHHLSEPSGDQSRETSLNVFWQVVAD